MNEQTYVVPVSGKLSVDGIKRRFASGRSSEHATKSWENLLKDIKDNVYTDDFLYVIRAAMLYGLSVEDVIFLRQSL